MFVNYSRPAMRIKGNIAVANNILQRLAAVKISLTPFLDSDVQGLDSTLKGINFRCKNLAAIKRAFDGATDYLGRTAFYYNGQYSSGKILRELIRNAPGLLDMSFAATDGYGYREIRDMPILPSLPSFRQVRPSAALNSRFGFDDEQEVNFEITSVHAALAEKVCNVHIDNFGFVMRGPSGAFLTADFGQHAADELGLKDKLAPLLGRAIGKVFRTDGQAAGSWIARNVNLELPNHHNGFRKGAGLSVTPTPNLRVSAKFTAKCGYCRNVEEDFGIPIPDGWSVGMGVTYKWK
jgi:hypothetical protein